MNLIKLISIILLVVFIFSCVEKTTYSGKIITKNDLSSLKISNKKELIKKFGQPSYFDNIQNKYFYYTEKTKSRHFFDQKTEYSFLFIFELDQNDEVIKSKAIDLLSANLEKFINEETENNVIKRGLIERIFGGVGAQRFPDSPQN